MFYRMPSDTIGGFNQADEESAVTMAWAVEHFKSLGASVGINDVVNTAGYGAAGVSGLRGHGLETVNALARELYAGSLEKFGSRRVYFKKLSSASKQLNGRIRFLKGLDRYAAWYAPATVFRIKNSAGQNGLPSAALSSLSTALLLYFQIQLASPMAQTHVDRRFSEQATSILQRHRYLSCRA